jgi:hypothetical protein
LKFAVPDSLNDNALPVCGRANGSRGIGHRNEGSDLSHEIGESRLLAKEHMICAVKIYKARSYLTWSSMADTQKVAKQMLSMLRGGVEYDKRLSAFRPVHSPDPLLNG